MSTQPQPQPSADIQPLHLQDWKIYVVLAIQLILAVAGAHGLNLATQPAPSCPCQSSPQPANPAAGK